MRCVIMMIGLFLSGFATAAPIPKSLKAKRPFDITGMWKLVEYNANNKPLSITGQIPYWRFTNESYQWYTDLTSGTAYKPNEFTTPDPDQPQFKIFHSLPCCFERVGHRMTWVYANDSKFKLEDCEPGPSRNVYVFELVE